VAAAILLVASCAFATLALALRVDNEAKARRWERLVGRWEPAMLEILAGAAPPEAIHERVDRKDAPLFLSFLLGYARRLRGEEQELVREMAEPYLPVVVPMVQRGTTESRGNAVLMLARMGLPRYAGVVASALDDESPIVAMIAARSLVRPGHEEHFPRVLAHLPRFAHWSRSFLSGMLSTGGALVAPLLRDVLEDRERDPLVRAVASDALRELNDLPSVEVAVHVLPEETDRELVAGCLRILKHLGHAGHVSLVRGMVANLDPVIRAAAVSTLGAIGGKAEIPILQAQLDDTSFWVSLEAARGLMALGDYATLHRLAASEGPWSTLARQVLAE
jgi:HEAT repeat protein